MQETALSPNARLKSKLDDLGLTYAQISAKTGIPKRTLHNLVLDGSTIKSEYLVSFSENFGISPNSILLADENNGTPIQTNTDPIIYRGQPLDPDEFTLVDFYNVKASAGFGRLIEDTAPMPVAFRTYFIKNRLRTSRQGLIMIKVDGDSMEPTIADDDAILIDQSQNTLNQDGIYLIRIDDIYQVKRIQRIGQGKCRLISDNKLYPPVEINIDDPTLTIIGRCVWTSHIL